MTAEYSIHVIALSDDREGPIKEAFADEPGFTLSWMSPDDSAAIEAKAPDLVLLDGKLGRSCANVILAARRWEKQPAIITLGDVSLEDLRALIGYPRAEAMVDNITADDLRILAITANIPDTNRDEQDRKSGDCWVLTGAVGGAGASLMAIELAYQLTKKDKAANKVCLLDLNFEDGSLATYLDVSPGLDVSTLSGSPERLDAAMISAFISRHESGLNLIAAPRGARFGHKLRPESILRLLEIACETYDHVVVDIPRWRQPWTAPLAQGADHFIVVSELTVPALHAARHLCEDIEALSANVSEPQVVLNRMSKRMFGHSVSVSQAEKALNRKTLAAISSDWDGAVAAVNMGMPVSMAKPGSRLAKDVSELLESLHSMKGYAITRKVA